MQSSKKFDYFGKYEYDGNCLKSSVVICCVEKSHSFSRLPVHLPNEQNVIIQERNGETDFFFNLEKKNKLLDYFDLNKRDLQASHYYYYEIPEHYIWKQNQCGWAKRKGNENTIGRMYFANPCQVELFYLRLLLSCVLKENNFLLSLAMGSVYSNYYSLNFAY